MDKETWVKMNEKDRGRYFQEMEQLVRKGIIHRRFSRRAEKIEDEDNTPPVFVVNTIRRDKPLPHRNTLCPCGSGKKFKKCCLSVYNTV